MNHPRNDELVETLKNLLANINENPNYDSIVDFVIKKTAQDVANYCNIPLDELPSELDLTIVNMALQVINTHQLLEPLDSQTGNIASLSEGDASVTFKSPAEVYQALQNVNVITDNYLAILNNFRKLQL